MKVVLFNEKRDASVVCFQNEKLEACVEYALMLHRSVFEPHSVSVLSDNEDDCWINFIASERVTSKRS